jgi:hypothetical protein
LAPTKGSIGARTITWKRLDCPCLYAFVNESYIPMPPSDAFSVRLSALFLVAIFAASFVDIPVAESILASHRGLYPMVSTSLAKVVYGALLFVLGTRCVSWSYGGRRLVASRAELDACQWGSALGAFALVFALGDPVSVPFLLGFWATVGFAWVFWRRPSSVRSLVSSSRVPLFVGSCALILFFWFACVALPFITPVVASDDAQLVSLQNHYAGYMPGFVRAVFGERSAVGVLNYGLGSAVLVEETTRLLGFWKRFDIVTAIKAVHILMLVTIGGVLWVVRGARSIPLFALMVLASPTLSLLSPALYYPNLSLIRFVPFIATIGVLAVASRSRRSYAAPLGALAGLAVVWALESGLVACGAILFFVFVREVDARGFWIGVRSSIASALVALVVVGLAPMIDPFAVQVSRDALPTSTFFVDFMRGYCGISTWPSPLSTIAFFFGAHAIARGAYRAGCRRLSRWDAYQGAVGVLILGWLFYYVHRMHPYNLYFQGGLIVFLCAPRLRVSFLRARSSRARLYGLLIAATLIGLSLDSISMTVRDSQEFRARRIVASHEPFLASSIKVVAPYSAAVARQVVALRALEPRDSYVIVTNLSVEARTLGFNLQFPWVDPFIDVLSGESMNVLAGWINAHGPSVLVVDDPDSALSRSVPHQTRHLQEVAARASSYRRVTAEDGWIFYERQDSTDKSQ